MAHKLGCLFVVLLAGSPVFASASGGIAGYVKDAAGAPQMGAVVEVFTSAATIGTTVFTDSRGHYSAPNLPPGLYQVKVSAASFLPSLRENVMLRAGAHVVVNLTLSTLADALKMMPARRANDNDADDWHWTLRLAANRPVLRVLDKSGPVLVSTSEQQGSRDLRARVAFIAGSEARGFGSNGDVTTAFALEKSVFAADTLSFNGNIATSAGQPGGVLRASYVHDFGNASRPRLTLTYRHFGSPGSTVPNSPYSALAMTTADSMVLGTLADLDYGAEVQSVDFARRVTAFRPYGSVRVHLSPRMVVEYRYATALPDPRRDRSFETAPADMTESGPRMALHHGLPDVERARHQEVSLSRRIGETNVQVGYYVDRVRNMVLTGAGDPSGFADDVLPDLYSSTFSWAFGGDLATSGTRVVVERKLGEVLTLTADYSTGGAVSAHDITVWQELPRSLSTERQQSVGAKCSGFLHATGARWSASYKWTSGKAVSQVDAYNASPGQMEPFLSFFIRQPLPGTPLIPAKMEALVDVRNLLAQGYVPVVGQDGSTVYLVQSARALRGGLAFTF